MAKIPYDTPEPEYTRLKADYILSNVAPNERGCLEYQGYRHPKGYGQVGMKDGNEATHRVVYRGKRGPIPEGWDVCHTCDNPPCVNPLHLFAAPRVANLIDMRNKGRNRQTQKTHCPHGHEYTPENTYVCKRGWRGCLKCQMIRNRLRAGWTLLEAETLPLVPQGAITARRDFKHRLRNSQSGKSGE